MELQQFVQASIEQIVNGIVQADAAIADAGGAVNPRKVYHSAVEGMQIRHFKEIDRGDVYDRTVELIDFDVVVTASEDTEAKGGIGIHIGAVGIGTAGKSGAGSSSESRIKFSVPVLFPTSKSAR